MSGAQIRAIDDEYGKYVDGNIQEEKFSFFVVMKAEVFKQFSERTFKCESDMRKELRKLSVLFDEYYGTFDFSVLCQMFPYLQEFFDELNEWREENSRLTVDKDILECSIKKLYVVNIVMKEKTPINISFILT